MTIEKDLGPARVSAFSDGVIAIIITIMVLELHVPHASDPHALLALWPALASYALSYWLVATYWVNHHHLFSMVKRVDITLLWVNVLLLFFLSLVPFLTAYVGQTRMAGFPVLCYSADMFICGLCFMVLAARIARTHFRGNAEWDKLYCAARRKNIIALALYVLAAAISYRNPEFSMLIIVFVALLYFIPGAWIDSALRE